MQNPKERDVHRKGDVVLVNFPFTDLPGEKRRPALVVGISEEHMIVAFITTKRSGPEKWHVSISPTPETGLALPSTIRCDKILAIDNKLITGAIGVAPEAVMKRVDALLKKLLKL